MSEFNCFRLHRLSDDVVYEFDRTHHGDGSIGYKRRDQDVWIIFKPPHGWVAFDEESHAITGRSWDVLPTDQTDHPPEGEWVREKGVKSYVYELRYLVAASPQLQSITIMHNAMLF